MDDILEQVLLKGGESRSLGGIDVYIGVVLFYMQYQIETFVQKNLFLLSSGLITVITLEPSVSGKINQPTLATKMC